MAKGSWRSDPALTSVAVLRASACQSLTGAVAFALPSLLMVMASSWVASCA